MKIDAAEAGVRALIRAIGEDPSREGLLDTPCRVVRAMKEMTVGYAQTPADILSRTFDGGRYDELVIVRNIRFSSLCEHHLLPFTGTATVAYLPSTRVVGLSKIPRLVRCFAKRLQIQEKMTRQIAEAIETHLAARGVGVIVQAKHQCMGCRGVEQPDADMVTSAMLGMMRKAALKAELFSAIGI